MARLLAEKNRSLTESQPILRLKRANRLHRGSSSGNAKQARLFFIELRWHETCVAYRGNRKQALEGIAFPM